MKWNFNVIFLPFNGSDFLREEFVSDFDECALGLDSCNRETEVCLNVYGGFNCTTKWASRRPPLSTTWTTPTRPVPLRPTAPVPTCQPGFKHDPNLKRCVGMFEQNFWYFRYQFGRLQMWTSVLRVTCRCATACSSASTAWAVTGASAREGTSRTLKLWPALVTTEFSLIT